MRKKNKLEAITQPGDVRIIINTVRSPLAPNWWEVGKRFRWMQLEYRVRNDRRKLSTETQVALAWAEDALEREFLFGKE